MNNIITSSYYKINMLFLKKYETDREIESIRINWENYIENNLIKLIGKKPQGNIYSKHLTNMKEKNMIPKQNNIVKFLKIFKPKNILEIGFNSGFSALLIKMTCPYASLTCIDINRNKYVIPCYEQISKDYQIELILKDSKIALQELITKNLKFDVIHIDGDHTTKGAESDFLNSLQLSNKGSVIIFDDTNLSRLDNLCKKYIKNKQVKEYDFKKENYKNYKNSFLEVL